MKKTLFLLLFSIIFTHTGNAQAINKMGLGVGVSYLFGKSANFKSAFEINTVLNFGLGSYVYLGPKASLTLLKENPFFEVGPNIGFNFYKFASEQIFNPENDDYKKVDMLVSTFIGFNLDGNALEKKKFSLTNVGVSLDVSSPEVLNSALNISYGHTIMYQRLDKHNLNFNKLGVQGVFKLNK